MAGRPVMGVEELIRKKVAALRYWKKTRLYKKHSNWKFQFSVMTYNILSQTAIDNHRFLYRNCDPPCLLEDYRVSRILPEILQSRSDIVCLQEVEEFVYETRMRKTFEVNGFGSIFMRRTTCKTDGCAILWRRDKFHLVGQNGIEFRTKNNKLLDRDNIGLIAVLKPRHQHADNVLLHVATTHLLFNPNRGDVKLCQLRWLLAELDRMALIEVKDEVRRYHPVILCGDFNFEPNSPLYQFVENGHIDVSNTISGDLSGQREGRNRGRQIEFNHLSLHKLGISDASRFEETPPRRRTPPKTVDERSSPKSSIGNYIGQSNDNSTDSKSVDLGSSKDPGLVASLLAYGNKQLAAEITSQIQNNTNNAGEATSSTDSDKSATEPKSAECFSHGFKFVPAYKFHHANQKDLPTSMIGTDFHTVDHIFYNVESKRDCHSYREGTLKLLSVYSLMNAEDLKEVGGLPNAGFGSDHICLGARFAICFHNHRR